MNFHSCTGAGSRPSSGITLFLPGLIWPTGNITPLLQYSSPNTLATLLGRARIKSITCRHALDWLFPEKSQKPPLGRIRFAGETKTETSFFTQTDTILCADPVSLFFARDALVVLGPSHLSITHEESDELIAMLNAEFGSIGRFWAASPTRWYLQTSLPSANFPLLADVDGRPAAFFQPEGEHSSVWEKICSDIQIALHAHPINENRAQQGITRINSIWFWGDGDAKFHLAEPRAARLFTGDPVFRGLFVNTKVAICAPQAEALLQFHTGENWWHEDSLQTAMLDGKAEQWHQHLLDLDQHLLSPLWQALRSGRIHSLKIIAPADKGGFEATVFSSSRWQFWRKAFTTDRICTLLQGSR